jgi:predicted DNA-binding protein
MISKDNKRILVTVPAEIKIQLEELAKKENRTLTNYIATVLLQHLEQEKKA